MRIASFFTKRNIATILLIVMTTQFVFIEGYGISPLKVGLMAIMPFVFLFKVPYVTKASIISLIYLLTIVFSSLFHPESFRFSTIGYLGLFLVSFVTFYNLIYSGSFSLDYFIKLIKWLIWAYAICLICQQLLLLVGIRFMPLVNLNHQFFLSIDRLPSLSIEPSHSARILGAYMYAYLECTSFQQKSSFKVKQLFHKEHRWVVLGFLWPMLTMGSGTAFIVLAVLSLYFINWRNFWIVIPILVGLVNISSLMGIKQFDRAYNTVNAALTLDNETVQETDGSASARITPMLNTINNLDLTKKEHWFGYGTDAGVANKSERMIADITDYGFLAYLFALLLVFSCSIRFWSIPTIMFFLGIGGNTNNIAYGWGILMIFLCIKYFHNKYKFISHYTI